MSVEKVLPGEHVSFETAYVVEDYPYGFRLRCKIAYWLEVTKHGARLVSRTTNPKKPGEVWNKPKASTYARFGAAMYLDESGHVTWSGLSEYVDGAGAEAWLATFGAGLPAAIRPKAEEWVRVKVAYDAKRAAGLSMVAAAAAAVSAVKAE